MLWRFQSLSKTVAYRRPHRVTRLCNPATLTHAEHYAADQACRPTVVSNLPYVDKASISMAFRGTGDISSSECAHLFGLELFDRHRVQRGNPTHAMLT